MTNSAAPWPYPSLIAHRGAGRHAPENTLAAMREGVRHGFNMVEYDVKLSLDGVPILLHDDDLDRTSSGTGRASEKTFKDLAVLDFGSWHSAAYAGEPIPTLHAVAAFTLANKIYSNIEIKPTEGADAQTGRQVALFARELWAEAEAPLLSSFSEIALHAAAEAAPELPRALLIAEEIPDDWASRCDRLGCIALHINLQYASRPLIESVRDKGYRIAVWTVNDAARARQLLGWGCDAIFTDEITTITPAF